MKNSRLTYQEAISMIEAGKHIRTMRNKHPCHLRYQLPYERVGPRIYWINEQYACEVGVDKNQLFEIYDPMAEYL
jgi:hypothetical protein